MPRKKGSKNKKTLDKIILFNESAIVEQSNKSVKKEKKAPPTKIDKKVRLITQRIGKNQSGLVIIDRSGRFYLSQRIEVKGKKDKFKNIFSHPDLKFIQEIADKLSENLKLSYNSNTIVKKQRKEKKSNDGKFEINHSLFKEYNGHCFIFLDFGTIWLDKDNKFHCKVNYEKIDGIKIYQLYNDNKFQGAYIKCKDLLLSYNEDVKDKILKETTRYGNFEDSNSIRVAMGRNPIEFVLDDTGKNFIRKEIIL